MKILLVEKRLFEESFLAINTSPSIGTERIIKSVINSKYIAIQERIKIKDIQIVATSY
jgi:hypothetical protein